MTQEVKDAIERIRCSRLGEDVYNDAKSQWEDVDAILAWVTDQHTAQSVDWPTSPGWWWMETENYPQPRIVTFDAERGLITLHGNGYVHRAVSKWKARFLPANIPTFPPREKD